MNLLRNIFWNTEQARIRSGFRLVLFVTIYVAIGNGLEFLIGSITNQIEFSSNAPLWVFLVMGGILLSSGVLCVWLAGRFLDRRLFTEFGFHFNREWLIDFSFGLGLGVLLISLIFCPPL
jgi:hypothetical protein